MRRAKIKPAINLGASRRPTTKPKPVLPKQDGKPGNKSKDGAGKVPKNDGQEIETQAKTTVIPSGNLQPSQKPPEQPKNVLEEPETVSDIKQSSQKESKKSVIRIGEPTRTNNDNITRLSNKNLDVTNTNSVEDSDEISTKSSKSVEETSLLSKDVIVEDETTDRNDQLSKDTQEGSSQVVEETPVDTTNIPAGDDAKIIDETKQTEEKQPDENNEPKQKKSPIPVRRRRIAAKPNLAPKKTRPLGDPVSKEKEVHAALKKSIFVAKKDQERKLASNIEEKVQNEETKELSEEEAAVTKPPSVQRVVNSKTIAQSAIETHNNIITSQSSCNEDTTPTSVPNKTKEPLKVTKIHPPRSKQKENVSGDEQTKTTSESLKRASHEGHVVKHGNIYEQRLQEMKEQLNDEGPLKKRRIQNKRYKEIDPSKMKMSDLIYFNPSDNPMKVKNFESKDEEVTKEKKDSNRFATSTNESEEENRPANNAPQVKIGPDGSIILDTESLVKEVTPKRRMDDSEIQEVHEDASTTTYSSFTKRKFSKRWGKRETRKFYRALSAAGTDFSMINALLPHRTRHEIKNKYKKEERYRKELVDQAFSERILFDSTLFEVNAESSSSDEEVAKKKKKAEKPPKKKKVPTATLR